MFSGSAVVNRAQYQNAPDLREVPNSPRVLGALKAAAPLIDRKLSVMSRLTFEGPRYDGSFHAEDPPQGTTKAGMVWDLVFSGDIEAMNSRWSVGAYNVADWKYDTVPSGDFIPRTIVQRGRTFLASLNTRF
jgi:outer membrane receptor protein involved in Fe transport